MRSDAATTSARETSTRYTRPYRPWPIAAANALGRAAARAGLGAAAGPRFEAASLLSAARAAEGLDDFGDDDFREPLDRLLDALGAEAALTPVGAFIARKRVLDALRNRLRVVREVRAAPALCGPLPRPPLVITGLQRTGTTFLQRLLGADPRLRALRSWEALAAVPFLGRDGRGRDGRRAAARTAERGLRYLAPDFFAIHPVDAEGPEEEVLLMDPSFRSPVPEATFHVPTYSRWLEEADQRPAYRWLRTSLALVARGEAPRPFLLKSPAHLEHLDVLIETFPGLRVVWTHRDPLATVASFSSMIAHGRGIFSDAVDPRAVGREWLRKTARMVARAQAVRDRVGDDVFLDVRYEDLVRDPVGTVGRVYDFSGLALDGDARARTEAARTRSPQHRFGRHSYRLEDFGLGAGDVEAAFAAYRARHGMATAA